MKYIKTFEDFVNESKLQEGHDRPGKEFDREFKVNNGFTFQTVDNEKNDYEKDGDIENIDESIDEAKDYSTYDELKKYQKLKGKTVEYNFGTEKKPNIEKIKVDHIQISDAGGNAKIFIQGYGKRLSMNTTVSFNVKSIENLDKFIKESFIPSFDEFLNEAAGTLKDKYEALIKNLEKAKIPCKVKLMKDEIVIECGWDFPDKIFHKVSDAADSANLKDSDISVCAEQSGGTVLDSKRINGGPKRY